MFLAWRNYVILFLAGLVTLQAYRISSLREATMRYKVVAEQQQANYQQKQARVAITLSNNDKMMRETMTRPMPSGCAAVIQRMASERY